jgi:hypothetical protein
MNSDPFGDRSKGFDINSLKPEHREFALNMAFAVENLASAREELLRRVDSPDSRDLTKSCKWKENSELTTEFYREQYERNSYAERTVNLYPMEAWQVSPIVYETDDLDDETPFELAMKDLCRDILGESWFEDTRCDSVWSHLKNAQILAGIGNYGVILLGLNDGKALDQPIAGVDQWGRKKDRKNKTKVKSSFKEMLPKKVKPPTGVAPKGTVTVVDAPEDSPEEKEGVDNIRGTDLTYDQNYPFASELGTKPPPDREVDRTESPMRLLYLREFDQSNVKIESYEIDPRHPRYGQPLTYRITLGDIADRQGSEEEVGLPEKDILVHWHRIIHVTDNGEIFHKPRMKSVIDNLMDLKKLCGGSAEMYWKGSFPGLSLETHPSLGGNVSIKREEIKEQMELYMEDLKRYLALSGMTAKSLAPQVVDPSKQIDVQIDAICVKLACPKRKFMGSELGELASSQDDSVWNDRLREYQAKKASPIISKFIDRLITVGVLPEPERYLIYWPSLETVDSVKMAEVGLKRTQALAQYSSGNCEALMPAKFFYTMILGLTDEETAAIVAEATAQLSTPEARLTQDPREKQAMDLELKKHEISVGTDLKEKQMESKDRQLGKGNGNPASADKAPTKVLGS